MSADLVCFVVFIVSGITTGVLYMIMITIAVPKGFHPGRCRNLTFFKELLRDEPDTAKRAQYKRLLLRFTIAEMIAVASAFLMILLQVLPQMMRSHYGNQANALHGTALPRRP